MHDYRIADPALERDGRMLGRTGSGFFVVGLPLLVPGVALVALTGGVAYGIGWALIALTALPLAVSGTLWGASAVARWAARDRSFA